MLITKKCQYALRAIFELARVNSRGPTKIAEIAEAQAIPRRFLEVILGDLKQGGFLESRRGSAGGYVLRRTPADLTMGEVMQFVQGPLGPVECNVGDPQDQSPLCGSRVFLPVWEEAREAVSNVYNSTTFQDLVERDERMRVEYAPCYNI